jgi:hypothetical protein
LKGNRSRLTFHSSYSWRRSQWINAIERR